MCVGVCVRVCLARVCVQVFCPICPGNRQKFQVNKGNNVAKLIRDNESKSIHPVPSVWILIPTSLPPQRAISLLSTILLAPSCCLAPSPFLFIPRLQSSHYNSYSNSLFFHLPQIWCKMYISIQDSQWEKQCGLRGTCGATPPLLSLCGVQIIHTGGRKCRLKRKLKA